MLSFQCFIYYQWHTYLYTCIYILCIFKCYPRLGLRSCGQCLQLFLGWDTDVFIPCAEISYPLLRNIWNILFKLLQLMFLHLTKHVSLTTTYFTMDSNPPTPTNMQPLSSIVKGQISIYSGVKCVCCSHRYFKLQLRSAVMETSPSIALICPPPPFFLRAMLWHLLKSWSLTC